MLIYVRVQLIGRTALDQDNGVELCMEMTNGTQFNYRVCKLMIQKLISGAAIEYIPNVRMRYETRLFSGFVASSGLALKCCRFIREHHELEAYSNELWRIRWTDFAFNLNSVSDIDCLVQFRFRKHTLFFYSRFYLAC